MLRLKFLLIALLFLGGCAKGQGISLLPYQDSSETPQDFRLCVGFGCSWRVPVGLSEQDWARVTKPLHRKAKTAEGERENIAKVIAQMERRVQANAQLSPDRGQAETFENDQHQMDCLDETINTSRALGFLTDEGLLHFHEVAGPIHRGYFVDGLWPHNSAAVMEIETGERYAIDSYYSDNGEEVHVVTLDEWLDAWRPEGAAD